ncbi:nuclear transport factor 2 family protein [Novosphingobium cyanobacteriorum]|uniref:Nuclear transport factor 2 family protein n=1 Tax=Novosphingobium cyanobacteriorum TaxID=3024215 RepID=A0ABT6CN44_9SPHN|nr:nuclear transport factor 2 family protein [Novosphingobium cyanobacteriorum]MDF8335339.1 nuclear transport factor 2 family protein [Novosphingobium cyanobacteriorum]
MVTPHQFAARHGILNALALHSRGVDRGDATLLAAAYHPGATVDYGFFSGPAETLVAILGDAQKAAPPTTHRTCNMWIKVNGDRAVSESYVIAHVEDVETQRMVLGRYLDSHACIDGQWRITHRQYVIEGNTNRPNTAQRGDGDPDLAHYVAQGGKQAADPGRALLSLYAAEIAASSKDAPAMTTPSDSALHHALARAEIHDLCMAYARGVDRADKALLASIFSEDSVVISGVINGSGAQFADQICNFVSTRLDLCFHSVANEWVQVVGDNAVGEHYAIAHMVMDGQDVTTGGRYLDRYVRRDGKWLIRNRTFVTDWNTSHKSSLQRGGFYEALGTWGCFGPADPVYKHWASLGE